MSKHCDAAFPAACAPATSSSATAATGAAHRTDAPPPLAVAVVDDDDSIRFLVQTLLERAGLQARTFASAEAFLEGFEPEATGCIVLDLQLPGIDGLALQSILSARGFGLPVIMLTAQGSVPKAVAALKNGAADFVEKPFDNKDLVRRIREHLDVETALRADRGDQRLATLTAREREVMEHVVAGHANKHIARELGICIKTVEFHRSRVMQKIGAHSVAELVRVAVAQGAARVNPSSVIRLAAANIAGQVLS